MSRLRGVFAQTGPVASALVLGTAGTAAAAARYANFGPEVTTQAIACASISFPPEQYIPQTAMAAFQVMPAKGKPASGDTPFFIGVYMAGVGQNCEGGGDVLPEFVLPAGVSVVDEPGYRPYWMAGPLNGQLVRQSTPVVLTPGPDPNGVTATWHDGSGNHLFQYANDTWDVIFIPVRTTRKLFSTGPPTSCTSTCDDIEVVSQIADQGTPTELGPWVGLFASAPSATRGTLALYAPSSVTPRQARRGFAVRVAHAGRRTKVTFKLLLNGHVVARARGVTSRQGDATASLKAARGLRAGSELGLAVTVGRASAMQTIRVS